MEALGTLAGGVAHDLNNILGGIVSYPDILLLDIPTDSPLRKPILTIQASGQKAAAIVQDLLTLARRGVAITEVVSLNRVISDYLVSPECRKVEAFHPDVRLETELEKSLLNIEGSPIHLSKTVMNLISNAAEAIRGHGYFLIKTQNKYIDKPVLGYDDIKEGDYVVLSVSDNGIGLSSEETRRIFEPFYTKKTMGRSGTGLGMAVVWGTVKDHDGYIDVQSTPGKGSSFTLFLPATRKMPPEDKPQLSISDYSGRGESILIVDDIKEQREIVTLMLEKLSYQASSVASGEEAVEYLQNKTVDLIVLDMIMTPNMDGLDTYKEIIKIRPDQKVIIASGFSESDRVREAQGLGAGEYIKKPYTLEILGVAVKNELENKR